jgi:hypothetical protein
VGDGMITPLFADDRGTADTLVNMLLPTVSMYHIAVNCITSWWTICIRQVVHVSYIWSSSWEKTSYTGTICVGQCIGHSVLCYAYILPSVHNGSHTFGPKQGVKLLNTENY